MSTTQDLPLQIIRSRLITLQVTNFLPKHPGGGSIILKLSGKDATEEYDPVHLPGTLEENLPVSACLGPIDPKSLPEPVQGARDVGPEPDRDVPTYNNTVYRSILLRPRVFIDCEKCNLTTSFLGYKLELPIFVSPAAMARLAHPDGEWGIAQACKKFGPCRSSRIMLVFGWQIYAQTDVKQSQDMLARINRLGSISFVCLTLDAPVPGKREHDERSKNIVKHTSSLLKDAGGSQLRGGGGIGQSLFLGTDPTLTWTKTLPWLAKHTKKPIILKGLQTHEDAYIAAHYWPQVQGIILSNHGGRAADTAPPSIHTLMEIRKYCPEVLTKIDVVVDGGIKRGTDVVKALSLGAKAVGIGRAALFGLGAGGLEGVERVLEILRDETATAMRFLGVEKVQELGLRHINTRAMERDLYNGPAGLHVEKDAAKRNGRTSKL